MFLQLYWIAKCEELNKRLKIAMSLNVERLRINIPKKMSLVEVEMMYLGISALGRNSRSDPLLIIAENKSVWTCKKETSKSHQKIQLKG